MDRDILIQGAIEQGIKHTQAGSIAYYAFLKIRQYYTSAIRAAEQRGVERERARVTEILGKRAEDLALFRRETEAIEAASCLALVRDDISQKDQS